MTSKGSWLAPATCRGARKIRQPGPGSAFPEDKMTSQTLIEEFRRDIGSVRSTVDERERRRKSHDFHWYSPVLTPQLENCLADVVVAPQNEAEIAAVVAVAV